MGEKHGQGKWSQILTNVEQAMAPYRERGIYVNVDFYAGAVYYMLGIPETYSSPCLLWAECPAG